MRAAEDGEAFQGSERFDILATLGRGATGVVYEAFDRVRKIRVALKTLTQLDPEQRYRFKREFRALSNVRHEHVVELFELMAEGETWYFTMELVDGLELMAHLRGERARSPAAQMDPGLAAPVVNDTGQMPDLPRLRRTFAQLCNGLHALHALGLLHRDVKPSNVLVTRQGRVVLVDFGIVAELNHSSSRSGDLEAMLGTPAYMAPEQVLGETVTAATDWYAVGVMLFEALTGCLPFEARTMDVLASKIERAAARASSFNAQIPEDLDQLCAALLATQPAARPTFAEIMRVLSTDAALDLTVSEAAEDTPLFVGREHELTSLSAALKEVRSGQPVLLHVAGTSGMGKSTLLSHFLQTVENRDDALILQGRCCEREAVPFKALDDLIDTLAIHLAAHSDGELPELPPGSAAALVRIFPVLAQVPAFLNGASPGEEKGRSGALEDAGNSRDLRARALLGLRALLRNLSSHRPVVLAIDDAQWGDEDSAALLAELTAPPDPPGVLLLLAYRREWEERAPLLMARLSAADVVARRKVSVDALPDERARAVAAHWLGRAADDPAVLAIVREAGGSPFLLMEFARHVRLAGVPAGGLDLATVLHARFAKLAPEPRSLLEALSVGARPLDPLLAARAALLSPEQGSAALRALQLAHLVRETPDRGGARRIETFHDRVRESVVMAMPGARVSTQHAQFVTALHELDPNDVEALYEHSRGAGQNDHARDYAARAAEESVKGLAFVRGAELFQAALELAHPGEARAQGWRAARADALAYAGRRKDAADAYHAAAQALPTSSAEAPFLECSAVEQYLAGGHPELGMPIAERTLHNLGMPLAARRNSALLSMGLRLGWLRLSGLGFKERAESELPREQLARIDAAHRVARGVSITDPIRGGEMFLRTVSLSLRAGEIKRISVALSCLSTMMAIEGPSEYARKLLELGATLATRSSDSHTLAVSSMNRSCHFALLGFFRPALTELATTDKLFSLLRGLETADQQNARSLGLLVRFYLGQIKEISQRVPAAVADAIQRGDAYTRGLLTTSKSSLCWLALDQPELHAELSQAGTTSKPKDNMLCIEHSAGLVNLVDNDLYVGAPARALTRLHETLPRLRASMMLRMVITQTQTQDALGRAALMLACSGHEPGAYRKLALAQAARTEKLPLPWPAATARLLRAGEADADRREDHAVALYRESAQLFDAADMTLHAVVCRLRLGQWLGGDEGRTLREDAERWLSAEGIVAPDKFAMMMAPTTR